MSIGLTDPRVGAGTLGFIGVIASADMAFSSVRTGTASADLLFHGFDNFTVAESASGVSEPATGAALLAGLAALGLARRRRS